MQKLLAWLAAAPEKKVTALLVAGSVLLALRLIQAQHGWVTDDSVLYFEIARLFALGEWQQGLALYQWPLYPALLALLHKISGLAIQSCAQGLAVSLFTLTTFALVQLIRLAGGNNLTAVCGALLLFSSQYIVGDILPMLIRDHGFWAFLLLGLVFFVRFYRDGGWPNGLLWQFAAIVAMLFRLEAITYIALLPLVLLFHATLTIPAKLKRLLQAYAVSCIAVAVLAVALLTVPALSLADLGRLREVVALFEQNYLLILQTLAGKAQLMGEQVLGYHLRDYGMEAIMLTLAMVVVFKTVQAAGWWTAGLLLVKPALPTDRPVDSIKPVLYWSVAIAVINAWLIVLDTFVLSSRYVIALALLLMLFAAFRLASLLTEWPSQPAQETRRKWLAAFFLVVISLGLVANAWPKKDNYNYEQDAVAWLKQHSAASSTIFYVSPRARYYAGAPYAGRGVDFKQATLNAMSDGSIHAYDYLVINIDGKDPQYERLLTEKLTGHRLLKEFAGYRSKKKILIFAKAS